MDAVDGDQAAHGRALLAAEPVAAGHRRSSGVVEIGGLVDDEGILAAHLEANLLDPELAGMNCGGSLVYPNAGAE